jgi:hypothetical protein
MLWALGRHTPEDKSPLICVFHPRAKAEALAYLEATATADALAYLRSKGNGNGKGNLKGRDRVILSRGDVMALGMDSSKTAARPSHEAIEVAGEDTIIDFKSDQQKLDEVAMRGAKRAENRINANEETIPGSTIFSK